MNLTPQNFRYLADTNFSPLKIRKMDNSPLILIKSTGEASFARTRADKDAIVAAFEPTDLLLFAWVGQWHTDIFHISALDLVNHYK